MATIPKNPLGEQPERGAAVSVGPRSGSYDGMPVDRPIIVPGEVGVTHAERDYFAQENVSGFHQGHSGDTVVGAAKGNRTPQHPAPEQFQIKNPFKETVR